MAAWHVPVHDESISEDILEDDLFEDNLEQTFPPLRYCAINQTRRPSKKLRRDSSRERERLYRELVGHAPYVVKQQSQRDDRFYIALDVKHYKPEEITIKVDGRQLLVSGKHYNSTENGFEASEFLRKYTIPENTDPRTLTSNITPDGVLCIKAIDPPNPIDGDKASDSDKFMLSLDVKGYRPDEISIRVRGNTLIVHGETRDENANTNGHEIHHEQFTRNFTLPYDLNMEALSSKYTKDEKITIEAPRGLNAPMRELEIKKE